MKHPARWILLASALLLTGMGPGICQPPDPLEPNQAPVARMIWPQFWLVSEPVPFDASLSEDFDGLILEHALVFGDGTEEQTSTDGQFEHLYIAPGTYDFRLEVRDDEGTPAELIGTVITVERQDDPSCDCDFPCLDDATCTPAGCFLSAARVGTAGEFGDAGTATAPTAVEGAIVCP